MNVLYHLPVLPPKMPETEALSQEIAALRTAFNGEIVYLNPNETSPVYLPRLTFGWHKLRRVRQMEAEYGLHHFFNPDPFPYPVLLRLRKPVVYSLSSGLGEKRPYLPYFSRLAAVTVYDERSYEKLRAWGLTNVHLAQSGIDVTRFTHTAVPLTDEIRLLSASAPWTKAQFKSKGIDALLAAAQQAPRLHLTFLWRGLLYEEMMARVAQAGVADRVQVINEQVDVNGILAKVHGTINLASNGAIIKAYPHSLLDSLAAGKPVLISRAIAMSDYVKSIGCGVVVDKVSGDGVATAVNEFVERYETLVDTAVRVGRDFSQEKMITSFRRVYETVTA
ncbi:MAG TPA: glycosyltransferase family 1 protein [Anaerolineae bacterium]|nr:glycosyltransferase family 1 protein [Anaerolineae bacterium]